MNIPHPVLQRNCGLAYIMNYKVCLRKQYQNKKYALTLNKDKEPL